MRFEQLIIEPDLSDLATRSLSLGNPFTILFGSNSAGKTRVLEAIERVLGSSGQFYAQFSARRSVPGKTATFGQARLVVALEHENPKERALHYKWLVDHVREVEGRPFELTAPATMDDAVRALVGPGKLLSQREVLAEAAAEAARWAIAGDYRWLWLDDSDLPPDAIEAARFLAADATSDPSTTDWLSQIARDLVSHGHAEHGGGAGMPGQLADLEELGLRVVSLPLAPQAVHALAQGTVVRALQLVEESAELDPPGTWGKLLGKPAGADWGLGPDREPVLHPEMDIWLVALHDSERSPTSFGINPLLKSLARLLGSRLAELCPPFVRAQGTPDIVVTDPRSWNATGSRVEVVLRGRDGREVSVDSLGAGTRRWAQAALSLVGASLPRHLSLERADADVSEDPVARAQERLSGLSSAIGDGLRGSVLLVDEPEAHLHPEAAASVAQWLLGLAADVSGLVIATHSLEFLALDTALVRRVMVKNEDGSPGFCPIEGPLADALQEYRDAMGLKASDLLLLHRAVLFVEGPHDFVVLDEWCGPSLRAAGVLVLPAHGVDNMKGLPESEVVDALGLRVGVLVDRTGPNSSRPDPRNREGRAVNRLLDEAERRGQRLRVFGLTKPDIVEYFPDAICASLAPGFPGWDRATDAWRRSLDGVDLKSFVTKRYHLRLDRAGVRTLARRTKEAGKIPEEVVRIAREIEAWGLGASADAIVSRPS